MNKPKEGVMSQKETEEYFKKMADPEYIKNRYEAMDRASEFMDLCSKGADWIVDINNFCAEKNIKPQDLIDIFNVSQLNQK